MSHADAIVVGSGAAGGWAAKELTEAGLRVLLLEAGPERKPARAGRGCAGGVMFVDAATGASHAARARLIVLCASTIETVRILLATRMEHPELPVSESDCLGHYLMDHVVMGTALELEDVPYEPPAPVSGADSYLVPRFQNIVGSGAEPYLRGYGLWGIIQRRGYSGRRGRPARGLVTAQGEMLPRYDNRAELNGDRSVGGRRLQPLLGNAQRAGHRRRMLAHQRLAGADADDHGAHRTRVLVGGGRPAPRRPLRGARQQA